MVRLRSVEMTPQNTL